MCVIVHKPAGVAISDFDLYDMWQSNKDGAGLAFFRADGATVIHKGIMNINDLCVLVDKLVHTELVLHFRLATHGKTNKAQTHPFIVTDNINDAKGTQAVVFGKPVLFHNGVISGYGNEDHSDTVDFVVKTLSKIPDLSTQLDVLALIQGKYAVLANGQIHLVGTFEKHGKLTVSNTYWKPKTFKMKTKKGKEVPQYSSIDEYWKKKYPLR